MGRQEDRLGFNLSCAYQLTRKETYNILHFVGKSNLNVNLASAIFP